jgi:Fic family protein
MTTAFADTSRDNARSYELSHPWLSFSIDLRNADRRFWQMVGEARSKCRHLMFAPLKPDTSRRLEAIYLAKGMQATTAIEGNTLTLEQVQSAIDGTLRVPPSQQYLKQEVDNVLKACRDIEQGIAKDGVFELTPDLLDSLNERILHGLDVPDHVVPGVYRDVSVVVGPYRGAPPRDIPFLTARMCDWLNGPTFQAADHGDAFLYAFLKAVAAHVYLAWIHPFGDGNGRTARLIEFGILTAAGIPSVAAHLLSNHYNLTRTAYYRYLNEASQSGGDLCPFFLYAAQGFVDLLQEQLATVHQEMFEIAWENYVHERFQHRSGEAARRQRELVIALGRIGEPVRREDIPTVTTRLAGAYANRPKIVTRDINKVVASGLVHRLQNKSLLAASEMMYGFTPRVGGHMRHNVLVDFTDVKTHFDDVESA